LQGGDENSEASFIRHVKRVEAEDFAGTLHRFVDWNQRFVQLDADVAVRSDLVQRCREASARQIAQAMDLDSGVQQRFDRRPDVGAVA